MFRPVEMKKIYIVTLSRHFNKVMEGLAKLGVVHLADARETFEKLESVIEDLRDRLREVPLFVNELKTLLDKVDVLMKKLEVEDKYVKLSKFKGLSVEDALKVIEERVDAINSEYGEFVKKAEELSELESRLKELESKFKEVEHLPDTSSVKVKLREELELVSAEFQMKMQLLRNFLESLREKHADFLLEAKTFIEMYLPLEESKVLTVHTPLLSFIEGFVPVTEMEKVKSIVEDLTDGEVLVLVSDLDEHEEAPVVLRTPKFIKPFETLIKTYDVPSYHEINPSLVVAITFPLIFGLMFADVGHGLLLALFGVAMIYAKKKGLPPSEMIQLIASGAEVYILCGVAAMFGGLMFGEMFGFHMYEILGKAFEHPPLGFILESIPGIGKVFSPLEDPMKMFKLSLIVGAIHIGIGLTLRILNEVLLGEYKEAFFGSVCWLWFYVGFIYLVLFKFKLNIDLWIGNTIPSPQNPLPIGFIAIVLPIIIMFAGMVKLEGFIDGFAHVFEAMISSLSHTVSYGRILALSLSHGILSKLLTDAFHALGLLGYPILAIGTIFMVMALEGLVSFTHVLRLTWVEFGFKYFHGGGMEFKPLSFGVNLYEGE